MIRSELIKLLEMYLTTYKIYWNMKAEENVNDSMIKIINTAVDTFSRRYSKDIESLVERFIPDGDYEHQLPLVIKETFVSGVSWGRIVSLLSFIFTLCKYFLMIEESQYIEPILDITSNALENLNIELSTYFFK